MFTDFKGAIENGDYSQITSLLANNTSILPIDASGNNLLHLAASLSKADVVEQIVEAGVDVKARNHSRETPLHIATASSDPNAQDTAIALLRSGAEIDGRNSKGETALHCAVHAANPDVMRTLLGFGADVTVLDGEGLTASEVAIRSGKAEMVSVFSEKRTLDLPRNARNIGTREPAAKAAQQPPSEPSREREEVCRYFKGFAWFWNERSLLQKPEVSVWELLYERMEEPTGATIDERSCMRWYNIPDTNVSFVTIR